MQAAELLLRSPANPAVACSKLERARLPADQRHPGLAVQGDMAQALADDAVKPQVVMLLDQTIPEPVLTCATGRAHRHLAKVDRGIRGRKRRHAGTLPQRKRDVHPKSARAERRNDNRKALPVHTGGKRRLECAGKIGERVGKVIGKYKMAKNVTWSIDDDGVFTYGRDEAAIAAEARLDGLCVIRTSLPQSELDGPGTVRAWKQLSSVERTFRSLKPVDLKVPPRLSPYRTPGPRPCLPVHARLLH